MCGLGEQEIRDAGIQANVVWGICRVSTENSQAKDAEAAVIMESLYCYCIGWVFSCVHCGLSILIQITKLLGENILQEYDLAVMVW